MSYIYKNHPQGKHGAGHKTVVNGAEVHLSAIKDHKHTSALESNQLDQIT